MASLTTRPNKTREIRTVPRLGRKVIRLGRVSAKQARGILVHVEALEAQALNGYPAPDATQRWLRTIDDVLADRLAKSGLIKGVTRYTLDRWIAERIKQTEKTAVPGTVARLRQSERAAVAYIGNKYLHDITAGECIDYAASLRTGKLAEATIRKRLGDLKQWLGQAVRHGLIDRNPMDGIATTVPATKHHAYIDDATALAVMNELPTAVQRAAFALSRWGGLRSFSEHCRLRWSDIDWHKERFTVHGKGKVEREVPLFPELVAPLHDLYEITARGTVEVFPGMKAATSFMRRPVQKAIKDAGFKPWPRLFHNLRASRQTDLIDKYGLEKIKTICSWIGNRPDEAIKSYLIERGREEAFADATAPLHSEPPVRSQGEPLAKGVGGRRSGRATPAKESAAESAAQRGEIRKKYGKENPADGAVNAASGANGDPYGIRTFGRGACTDNYLRAFGTRRMAVIAPV